ncbi:MAG: polysaccharide pyruvyl transferase family protein [Candidatus Marinimicrobia bacterium]|nr:polysaccharide pyruvyl transferase family protein [Candidatus Neomarinimicrobiota bacterium]
MRHLLFNYLLVKRAYRYLEQYVTLFSDFDAVFPIRQQVLRYYYEADYTRVISLLEQHRAHLSSRFVVEYLALAYFMKNQNAEALKTLSASSSSSHLNGLKERIQAVDYFNAQNNPSRQRIAHVAWHYLADHSGNAGDKLLPETVQKVIRFDKPDLVFDRYHVHQHIDQKQVDLLNEYAGIVIGGGGLVYPASAPSFQSGWQWNISLENLKALKVPIAFFAVGYNSFRDKVPGSRKMIEHLTLCAEKSNYLGFRHLSDVRIVQTFLPEALTNKIRYQPCPTTLLKHLYPTITKQGKEPFISLNFAYDRFDERFKGYYKNILGAMAKVIQRLSPTIEFMYYAHSPGDKIFVKHLKRAYDINMPCLEMYTLTPEEIIKAYRTPYLSLGMRGHAGLIPFGAGTIPLGLVAHRKVSAFFEDIEKPDLALDIHAHNFANVLEQKIRESLEKRLSLEEALLEKQHQMWKLTRQNVAQLNF